MFIAWEMPEGETFPELETSKTLATKFTSLWYSSDMGKQWQSRVMFHTYYLQLKRDIEVVPHIMLNTLHKFRPFVKFHADINFIYIIAHRDKHKEVIQSYYKLTEEDLEEITKEWHADLLILVDPTELSDPKLIGILVITREEHDTPGTSRRKKIEEVQ
jgi:hypothetical protein